MALLIITTICGPSPLAFMASTLRGTSIAICGAGARWPGGTRFSAVSAYRGNSLKTVGLYMLVGAMQLG